MEMKTSFETFMQEIRPTSNQSGDMRRGHRTLRTRLLADTELSPWIVGTFLQGSYRRSTAVRPKGDERSDVDLVVVTRIPQSYTPADAQALFYPLMRAHYAGKWRKQGRSIGISLSYVDLDLVITSAPTTAVEAVVKSVSSLDTADLWSDLSETRSYAGLDLPSTILAKAEQPQWKQEPLYIPNRDAERWDPTHPLAQITWTQAKNARTNGHYVNVVKAIKWWRRNNPNLTGHPKGYPLEHLIGQCCPDGITSIAAGITLSLEAIVAQYGWRTSAPELCDHGVPTHNVMGRVSDANWKAFIAEVRTAADIARRALNATTTQASADAWRELLGSKFPVSTSSSNGLLKGTAVSGLGFQPKPGGPTKPGGFA
ncbi:nucleotidyltransferase (plasmid) [Deinococcus actinosclerus]|nr:nucleotidyltransferase [Deinococcus actinosclerus]